MGVRRQEKKTRTKHSRDLVVGHYTELFVRDNNSAEGLVINGYQSNRRQFIIIYLWNFYNRLVKNLISPFWVVIIMDIGWTSLDLHLSLRLELIRNFSKELLFVKWVLVGSWHLFQSWELIGLDSV